ncbi:potassium channel family protein [Halosegnis sp.]|uniref:potassium channel family protein n=1 Tax=Halosegnis sp. TaxID=2864959 RepID=UPI0035D52B82
MKFIIVGYGRVGRGTVRDLEAEGHDVTVVEVVPERAERARAAGFDVIEGDCENATVLEQAGVVEADALAALTGDLNANFAACMIAREHGCRTVLRIDEDYREEIYERYAEDVDEIIYPERLGAAGAKTALLGGSLNVLADVTENLTLATVEVPDGSPRVGERVVALELPGDARVYAHGHHGAAMDVPLPSDELAAADRLAVITDRTSLDGVRSYLTGEA